MYTILKFLNEHDKILVVKLYELLKMFSNYMNLTKGPAMFLSISITSSTVHSFLMKVGSEWGKLKHYFQ